MPRRASTGLNPGIIIGIVGALAIVFFLVKMVMKPGQEGMPDGTPLPVATYIENGNSLRGNEYVVSGKVEGQIRWTSDKGQVISLRVSEGSQSDFLSIEIPHDLSKINIEREQSYAFKIRVRDKGIAVAQSVVPLSNNT